MRIGVSRCRAQKGIRRRRKRGRGPIQRYRGSSDGFDVREGGKTPFCPGPQTLPKSWSLQRMVPSRHVRRRESHMRCTRAEWAIADPRPPSTVLFGSQMATGAGFHQKNQRKFIRFAKAGNYLGTLVSRAWATDPLIGIHGGREADLPKWGAKGSTVRERRPCGARGARTGPTLRDRFRPHWIGVYGERPRASHVCHLSGHGDP